MSDNENIGPARPRCELRPWYTSIEFAAVITEMDITDLTRFDTFQSVGREKDDLHHALGSPDPTTLLMQPGGISSCTLHQCFGVVIALGRIVFVIDKDRQPFAI